jgi:hypothetical protein
MGQDNKEEGGVRQGSCIYSKKEEEPRTHTDPHGLVV